MKTKLTELWRRVSNDTKTTIHAIIIVLVAAVVITLIPEAPNVEPQGDPERIAEIMEELRERSDGSMYARIEVQGPPALDEEGNLVYPEIGGSIAE